MKFLNRPSVIVFVVILFELVSGPLMAQDTIGKESKVTIQPGDVVGMHVELSQGPTVPTTHLPNRTGLSPFVGNPYQVMEDGTVTLPYVSSLPCQMSVADEQLSSQYNGS